MRIVLLSRRSRSYSTKRLAEAARAAGHTCLAVDPDACALAVEDGRTVIYHKSRRIQHMDAVIPRMGGASTEFAVTLLHCLEEELGIPSLNDPDAMALARDRLGCLRALGRGGVRVPRTLVCRRPEEIGRRVPLVGGPPILLKVMGVHGSGTILASNMDSIISIVESFWEAGKNILLQQAVSGGRQARALVVEGRVVSAVLRPPYPVTPRGRGRRATAPPAFTPGLVDLTRAGRALAARAAAVLGLRVAAVDVHEGRGGPMVLDVNPAPSLEEQERNGDVDAAAEVVRSVESLVQARAARLQEEVVV